MSEYEIEPEPRLDLAGNPLPPLPGSQVPSGLPPPSAPTPGAPPYGSQASSPMPQRTNGMPQAPAPVSYASAQSSSNAGIAVVAGAFVVIIALVAVFLLTPRHTPAPTSFTTYTAPDKSFSCDEPAGWTTTAAPSGKMSDGSASTVGGVLFQMNAAKIDITTDTYTTLVAYDVMNNNADPQSLTGSKAGVLHKQWRAKIAAEHKGYTETKIADFEGQMEDARLAEWTASGNALGLGGKLHGYRASLTGGGKTAEVVCECLDADWPALKPAFQRILASFAAGEAAAPLRG